jgi:hypothetical protein
MPCARMCNGLVVAEEARSHRVEDGDGGDWLGDALRNGAAPSCIVCRLNIAAGMGAHLKRGDSDLRSSSPTSSKGWLGPGAVGVTQVSEAEELCW